MLAVEEERGLLRWLGLWRLVYGRVRSDWPFLTAVWLLIAGATTLLAAGTLYAETVELGGLRRALAEAAPAERGISVSLSAGPAEVSELDDGVRSALGDAFRRSGAEVALTIRSSALRALTDAPGPSAADLMVLGAYEGIERHAVMLEGRWPEPGNEPIEAALSVGAAQAVGLRPGAHLSLADASSARADPRQELVEVAVVGIYQPAPDDHYWLGERLDIDGVERRGDTTFVGPLMVAAGELVEPGRFTRLDLRWRALPAIERMRIDQLEATRAAISGLPGTLSGVLPEGLFVAIERGLADVLGRIDRSALVSRSGVVLITLQFGVLAAYAVFLAGGILAERRRAEVGLLRARGASTAEVGLVAAGEAAVLSGPAVLLAPWLALVFVDGIGRWGAIGQSGIIAGARVSEPTLIVAFAAGAACVAAIGLPALLAEIDLARVRAALGRPLGQTVAQRLGLDLVLIVLAAIGIVQLRTYGATLTQTTAGRLDLDPLLVAAPAISLAAGAVLVLRLVPRLGEVAEWLLRRRPGIVLSFGARQIARRPLRYTRAALLIVLAAALGTFGAMYSATWSQSQVDQATYQTGGDLRVVSALHSRGSTDARTAALRALPGVVSVAPVARLQLDVGRALRGADVLAADPEILADMVDRDGSDHQLEELLGLLAEARPQRATLLLPAGARRIAVVLDADVSRLHARDDPHLDLANWPGISVAPMIDAGDGTVQPLAATTAVFEGHGQRVSFTLPPAAAGVAARLTAVDVTVNTPVDAIGHISLRRIESAPSEDGGEWSIVANVDELDEWSFVHLAARSQTIFELGGASITGDSRHPLPACLEFTFTGCAVDSALYRWRALPTDGGQLAAVASERFMGATGATVGDTLAVEYFRNLELVIVGTVATFPSLDPLHPFAVVDATSLNQLRADHNLGRLEPTEWWVAAADEGVADVADAARREPILARDVVTRVELTRSLQRDPIALGLVGALLLGSLAAAAFAVIGLLVTAVVSAREQLGELALMRALGVSTRQVVAWLSLEHLFLLVLGLVAGAGLGALIALLVLPFAPLNRSGSQVVPSPQIVVPWDLLGLAAVGAAAVVILSVLVARREITARPVVDVLRERED